MLYKITNVSSGLLVFSLKDNKTVRLGVKEFTTINGLEITPYIEEIRKKGIINMEVLEEPKKEVKKSTKKIEKEKEE